MNRRAERLAHLLRQARDLGEREIVLEGMDRTQALNAAALLAQGASGAEAAGDVAAEFPLPPERAGAYQALRDAALACAKCELARTRKNVVFSDGGEDARLIVVGEAPGAREDESGIPFVGPAGQLLDLLLETVGLSRKDSVYICNVLKCRPPGNRNPLPHEIEACSGYLRGQIELVQPEVLLAVGTFAGQLLTGQPKSLGSLRGTVYTYEGTPLVVTYHPAALLRNGSWVRKTWDDLQLLRQVMDG